LKSTRRTSGFVGNWHSPFVVREMQWFASFVVTLASNVFSTGKGFLVHPSVG
jgi:hypothetical protein